MRNIWTIFKTDIRTLSRCFFACVVVLAIVLDRLTQGWFGSGKEQDTPDADGEN